MGKESNVGEGTDADIEKWWEKERQIFLRRTASFTVCMHHIQGNRKFSPWKGSVVDSVIGVFLTQNVSDHLSSSAFMSLAARFPVKTNSGNTAAIANVETPVGLIVTEPNIYDQYLSDMVLGLTVTSCANTVEGEDDKIRPVEDVVSSSLYSNSFTSFTQLLHMANNKALHATNVIMGDKKRSDWPTLVRSNEVPNAEALSNDESRKKNKKSEAEKASECDWDSLRKQVFENGFSIQRSGDAKDSMDYNALKNADVNEISKAIRKRGMKNMLAERIQAFLDQLARDHGSLDLEWLSEYLLSVNGLGLKSAECIRLLTLHQLAFPLPMNLTEWAPKHCIAPLQALGY